MRGHALSTVIGLAIGLLSWVILSLNTSEGDKLVITSAFIALFFGLLLDQIFQIYDQRRETTQAIAEIEVAQRELVNAIAPRIRQGEEVAHLFQFYGRRLTPEEVSSLWRELLFGLQGNYRATNYIENIYESDWAKAALLIQIAKKSDNPATMIQKVFLMDNLDELVRYSPHMEEQRKHKIEVHPLPVSELRKDQELWSEIGGTNVPSIDFGIFEGKYVLVWDLESRILKGGSLLVGEETVSHHENVFNKVFQKATEYNRDGHVELITIPEQSRDALAERINQWPPYVPPYGEMDYALRKYDGWLYKQGAKSSCSKFAAYADGALIGFSLLVKEEEGTAEFYVAVHPSHLGSSGARPGFGKKITRATLRAGFAALHLKTIHLKVRKEPRGRIKLYEACGFSECGTTKETVNHVEVEFLKMRITAEQYEKRK